MTERFEITSILQRALVNDPATFGDDRARAPQAEPGVYMESVHHLMKMVAGAPNIRPAWFFDTAEQGEGLNDIGTHLVDLVQWTLFPGPGASTTATDVQRARGAALADDDPARRTSGASPASRDFPAASPPSVKDGTLEYFCNTLVTYTLRGIHTKLNVIWDWEAPAGAGDTHFAFYRGRARASRCGRRRPTATARSCTSCPAARRGQAAGARRRAGDGSRRCRRTYPGRRASRIAGAEIHVAIPDAFRVGHEAHFAR